MHVHLYLFIHQRAPPDANTNLVWMCVTIVSAEMPTALCRVPGLFCRLNASMLLLTKWPLYFPAGMLKDPGRHRLRVPQRD